MKTSTRGQRKPRNQEEKPLAGSFPFPLFRRVPTSRKQQPCRSFEPKLAQGRPRAIAMCVFGSINYGYDAREATFRS